MFVNIVPGTQDFAATVKREINDKMSALGMGAGDEFATNMAKGLGSAGKTMRDAGAKLSLFVTAPLALMGTEAIRSSADFGVAMASLQVNAGASGVEMDKMRALAVKMGADTVFSAGEAANAMLELSKGGMTTAAIQGGALQSTMALAATESMNLADAATIVTNTMNQFGLSASKSESAVNTLAAGAVASTAGVADLADALKYVGATANSLNVSLPDTVTALAMLNNAGIDSTTAGTSLNRMLLGLIPTSRKAAEEAQKLGLNFIDSSGSLKPFNEIVKELTATYGTMGDAARTASLKQVFGVEGMRAAQVIIDNGVKGWTDLSSAVNKNGVANDLANARMAGLAGAIEMLKGSVDTAFLAVGDRLSPAVQALSGFLTGLVNGFASLSPGLQGFIVSLAVGAAIIGPLLVGLGAIAGALSSMITAVQTVKAGMEAWQISTKLAAAAQWLLNAAMDANPIMLIVLAVAAVVAALVWFFTQTELGRTIWEGFVKALGAAWTWLWETVLQPVFDAIGKIFTWLWTYIVQPIIMGIVLYISIWAAIFTWLWNTILAPIFKAIGDVFVWIWNVIIKPIVDFIVAYVKMWAAIFTWLYQNIIKPAFDGIGKVIQWVWTNVIKPVFDFIGSAVKLVGDAWTNTFGKMIDFIRQNWPAIMAIVRGPINAVIDLINGMINGINSIKIDIPDWLQGLAGGAKTISFHIPKIPRLAKGGFVDKPTTALIGEAGPEVVTPLKDFERMMGIGNGSPQTVIYNAAPNQSIDSEQALQIALKRAKVLAAW